MKNSLDRIKLISMVSEMSKMVDGTLKKIEPLREDADYAEILKEFHDDMKEALNSFAETMRGYIESELNGLNGKDASAECKELLTHEKGDDDANISVDSLENEKPTVFRESKYPLGDDETKQLVHENKNTCLDEEDAISNGSFRCLCQESDDEEIDPTLSMTPSFFLDNQNEIKPKSLEEVDEISIKQSICDCCKEILDERQNNSSCDQSVGSAGMVPE